MFNPLIQVYRHLKGLKADWARLKTCKMQQESIYSLCDRNKMLHHAKKGIFPKVQRLKDLVAKRVVVASVVVLFRY